MQMAEEDPRGKRKLVLAKFNCEQVRACASLEVFGVSLPSWYQCYLGRARVHNCVEVQCRLMMFLFCVLV